MINLFKKRYMLLVVAIFSNIQVAQAGCVPERHFTPLKCIPTKVASIAGSNGDLKLIEIQQSMAEYSLETQKNFIAGFQDLQKAVVAGGAGVSGSVFEAGKINSENEALMLKALKDSELSYFAEIEATKIKGKRAVMFPDDSPEETNIILEALKKANEDENVLIISQALRVEWDDQPTKQIPISLEMSKGVCKEEDIEDGKCSKLSPITPGSKLEAYFVACSSEKGEAEVKKRSAASRDIAMQESSKSVNEASASTNSSNAIASKLEEQNERNCTIENKKNGICGNSIEEEEMQALYRQCVINENGNVSASNMLTPSKVCSLSVSTLDKETYEVTAHEALDHTALEENPDQDQNAAPVVYSYKNTNQLRSALDYADNLIAMHLMSNQLPKDRKSINAVEYQSRYKSRLARLSLAKQAVLDTVSARIGKKLADQKIEDPNYESADPLVPIKESSLGGGELDSLYKKVETSFEVVDFSKDGANKEAIHGQAADGFWDKEMLKQITLQNELLYKQILQKEKEIMLKSAQVASEVNSPNNIIYMKQIRSGK